MDLTTLNGVGSSAFTGSISKYGFWLLCGGIGEEDRQLGCALFSIVCLFWRYLKTKATRTASTINAARPALMPILTFLCFEPDFTVVPAIAELIWCADAVAVVAVEDIRMFFELINEDEGDVSVGLAELSVVKVVIGIAVWEDLGLIIRNFWVSFRLLRSRKNIGFWISGWVPASSEPTKIWKVALVMLKRLDELIFHKKSLSSGWPAALSSSEMLIQKIYWKNILSKRGNDLTYYRARLTRQWIHRNQWETAGAD